MHRTDRPTLNVIEVLAVVGLSAFAVKAADVAKPDFSGVYTLTGAKGSFKMNKASRWIMEVVQTDIDVRITKTIDGRATTNRFLLDGTEAPFTSEGNAKGACSARFKGRALMLDTQVTTSPQRNGPDVQIHTKEQWTLSSDLKTLTLRSDVDFPKSGLGGFQLVEPWSEIYTRSQP